MKNDQKIIIGIGLVFIIPLALSLIFIIFNMNVSEDTAFKTTIKDDLAAAVSEENDVDLSSTVLHEVAKSGSYVAVSAVSVSSNDFGNSVIYILKKEDGKYKTVYTGTSFNTENLTDIGVPSSIIIKLQNGTTNYSDIIEKSPKNPRNKYTLLKNLPFSSDYLKITYYFKDELKDDKDISIPVIKIAGTDAAERRTALFKIKKYKADIGYYPVTFTNFKNPFTPVNSNWDKKISEYEIEESSNTINLDDEEGP